MATNKVALALIDLPLGVLPLRSFFQSAFFSALLNACFLDAFL
jgi:hypothetical protein|tara:strand:- start:332 stop:460 length:129 start_codon:yes stop_codon:yes gene_type:complete